MPRAAAIRITVFAAVFLFALAALLPLRVAIGWLDLDDRGFAARQATGSVWLGALDEAQFGPAALGDVGTRLSVLPLLLGRLRLELERSGMLEGTAALTSPGFGFDDVTGRIEPGDAFAPLPVETIELSGVSLRFAAGRCASAEGTLRLRLGGAFGAALPPGGASGSARCEGTALLVPLASQSGMEAIMLRIFADGRWNADVVVRPSDDAARDRLLAAGFRPGGSGYRVRLAGRF